MELILLRDIVLIFAFSTLILYLFNRLRIPSIIGFILTGALVGPQGLGLIRASIEVRNLANIGIILMLFTIGIEFSIKTFLQARRPVLLGGSLQVLLAVLAGTFISSGAGRPLREAIFIGFLLSLSSTAIVLKIFQDKAELDSPHGATTLGILIFQDLIIVPMMLVTPFLAGVSGSFWQSLFLLIIKAAAVISLIFLAARWLVPSLLYQVTRTRSSELFLLSIVLMILSIAWLTASIGLSIALGAFLAGLIISESEYSQQALSNILPFRDVFTSFFFITIGMLLNIDFLLTEPLLII
ncbi:MAG: cation:proton antiporter domain-containing protein [Candidatus Aquicultor sp.]